MLGVEQSFAIWQWAVNSANLENVESLVESKRVYRRVKPKSVNHVFWSLLRSKPYQALHHRLSLCIEKGNNRNMTDTEQGFTCKLHSHLSFYSCKPSSS